MRYVKVLGVAAPAERFPLAREVFRRYGIDAKCHNDWIDVPFEKSDHRLADVQRALNDALGHGGSVVYRAVFEPEELEQAALVILRVRGFCGDAFETWQKKLGLLPGTRVMDKRDMGKRDIARTFNWKEIVISERLKEILTIEKLTGWTAEPIQHVNPSKDRFSAMYQLGSSHILPALSPETEIEVFEYPGEPPVLVERGPLHYRRSDLTQVRDVNWTAEVFLEPGVSQRYFLVSQRTRRIVTAHKVRGSFEFEPIVTVE